MAQRISKRDRELSLAREILLKHGYYELADQIYVSSDRPLSVDREALESWLRKRIADQVTNRPSDQEPQI